MVNESIGKNGDDNLKTSVNVARHEAARPHMGDPIRRLARLIGRQIARQHVGDHAGLVAQGRGSDPPALDDQALDSTADQLQKGK